MFAYVFGMHRPAVLLLFYGDEFTIGTFLAWLPWILIIYLFIRFFGKLNRPTVTEHRYQLFGNLQTSTLDFYKAIEDTLKEMQVPDLKISVIYYHEDGLMSAKRAYLRVQYKGLGYTICGAPYGTSFFISWREDEQEPTGRHLVSNIPHIGKALAALLSGKSRYREDTEIMYRETMQAVLQRMVEQLGQEKGFRGFAELEKKPLYVAPNSPNGDH
jgi:hypothetical protein